MDIAADSFNFSYLILFTFAASFEIQIIIINKMFSLIMKKLFLIVTVSIFTLVAFGQDKTAKDYKVEGKEAYDAKDYASALSAFEKAIQLYEESGSPDTTLYYNAGICAIKVKDYSKSRDFFVKSQELDYKKCKAQYYEAVSLKALENNEEMVTISEEGYENCIKEKSKFSKLLFGYYQKEGLSIYNTASTMLNSANQYNPSNLDKYKSEMVKVKAEFSKALPLLEKAKSYKNDETVNTAIEQAKTVINSEI